MSNLSKWPMPNGQLGVGEKVKDSRSPIGCASPSLTAWSWTFSQRTLHGVLLLASGRFAELFLLAGTVRVDQGRLISVEPVILPSARRHRVEDQDILHAYRHPVRVFVLEDLTMLIGADRAARLIEVGVSTAETIVFIVHAMPVRPKFLEN